MRAQLMTLRCHCKPSAEPAVSHSTDQDIRNLAPQGHSTVYSVLTSAIFNNLPQYSRPQFQINLGPDYHPVPVAVFRNSDVQAAKFTYPQHHPAMQRIFVPVVTAKHAPTHFAEQFLVAQRAAETLMQVDEVEQEATLQRQNRQTNRFTALMDAEDEATGTDPTGAHSDGPQCTTDNHLSNYLSQTTAATGSDDPTQLQRSSALT